VKTRPIVGITSYSEPARWGPWHEAAIVIHAAYVSAVRAAGGVPVVLPPGDADCARLVARLDALVLAGGADIDPQQYGAVADPRTTSRPDRDRSELGMIAAAGDLGLPVLGVCRGMQLLAVAAGGTLHQHLPDLLGHDGHQPAPGVIGKHRARFAEGSRAESVFGRAADVNSYHHQAVSQPGRLTVTGWSDDGVIEAVEDRSAPFVLGVQWHPEASGDIRPFAALVEAASVAA